MSPSAEIFSASCLPREKAVYSVGIKSAVNPKLLSVSAVPLPMTAIRFPYSSRRSSPLFNKRPNQVFTPFGLVKTSHLYCSVSQRSGFSSGTISIVFTASATAPYPLSTSAVFSEKLSVPVTAICVPKSGSSSAESFPSPSHDAPSEKCIPAVSPITITDGDFACSAAEARSLSTVSYRLSSAEKPLEIIEAGVSGAFPYFISCSEM